MIVTTRNPCVGNAVPWVRAGVGAVATQGGTRLEYGNDLLDLLAKGVRRRKPWTGWWRPTKAARTARSA